ncbi:MAG TPA: ATP-binding protein [Candidatus Saccharimonadales bacterium]|nr:ATP-binding protein [Candidatus Saccharimonadales bacterium]
MDSFQKYLSQVRGRLFTVLIIDNLLVVGDWYLAEHVFKMEADDLLLTLIVISLINLTVLPWLSTRLITQPTKLIWQAILHIAPDTANVPAPDLKRLRVGRDMVTNLVGHIYQMANVVDSVEEVAQKRHSDLKSDFIANNLPLPLIVLDKNQTVLFANRAMCQYVQRTSAETVGQNVYSVLDMSFGSAETFDRWLEHTKATNVAATKTWERVRLHVPTDDSTLQFDLAAFYNKNNPENFETLLILFDHTQSYSQDDQALSFVALAVHELRTPITLMRGYIEALEENLDGKLDPETIDFIHKMKASAQSLSAFINNMLNVARVEDDQLTLTLHEDRWPEIVQAAINDLSLRARVQGVSLKTEIAPNLPTVGVDRVSIYEVLANLIDNAIKYTPPNSNKKIVIKSMINSEGLLETTITDQGAGIPASILPNLFKKFYRSHRSRNQVGGTGLGLYLSKAIVDAHGGHIWVRSKEGEGSTFGFTILPYTKLADEQKNGDNNDITRGAHGWIKNHSLYSR